MEGNTFKELKEIVKFVLAECIYQDNLELMALEPINILNEKNKVKVARTL